MNITKLIRSLTIATIILSTTDIIRLPIGSISIYRVIIIITSVLALIYTLIFGKVKKGRYLYFILLLLASPLAYFVSTNKEWALSFMLNDFMGVLLVFLICNFFTANDKDQLMKAFIQSQYFTIAFSGYSLFMYYLRGGIPQNITFLKIFSISLSEEFLRRGMISNHIRVSLPYATPPHLSIIMAIAICILVFNKNLFSNKTRNFLIGTFSGILLLTNSRTGIVAGAIVILLSVSFRFNYKFNISKALVLITGILISGVVLIVFDIEYIDKLFGRFIINDITQDRHLLVPLEGILIWLSSIKNFFIGIGYGSSINLIGRYTFLPPYFLNSFVTLIAEKGLIGLMIVFEFIRLFMSSLNTIRKSSVSGSYKAINYSYLIVFCSFLFYEAKQNISIWVIISIFYMVERLKNNVSEV